MENELKESEETFLNFFYYQLAVMAINSKLNNTELPIEVHAIYTTEKSITVKFKDGTEVEICFGKTTVREFGHIWVVPKRLQWQ